MKALPRVILKTEYRANIYAQGLAFLINIFAYIISANFSFIWIELACLSFIGNNNTKAPTFFDRNIFNHFISIIAYYILAFAFDKHNLLYLCLVFVFTYYYFILKDQGYNKSMQLWMYVQALLIGTTFPTYPLWEKIAATLCGYLEAQLILNLAFAVLSSPNAHSRENKYIEIFNLNYRDWLDIRKPHVQLAIRGALTAVILYSICLSFHDIKPNWAVVAAIACLQRDDYQASLMAIKGLSLGTLLAWPLAALLICFAGNNLELVTAILWLSLLIGLTLSIEIILKPNLIFRILSSAAMLIAITCVALALKTNSYTYLNLKVLNSMLGCVVAIIILSLWEKIKYLNNKPQIFDT